MTISINDDCDLEKKNGIATRKLLLRLKEHHDFTVEIPPNYKKPKDVQLCENCRDPLLRIDGVTRVQDVKRAATRYFKLGPFDIDSHRKTGKLAIARQITMYLSRSLTFKSYPEIARRIGGRDHTTVIYACNKIEKLVKDDWQVAFDVAHVEAML